MTRKHRHSFFSSGPDTGGEWNVMRLDLGSALLINGVCGTRRLSFGDLRQTSLSSSLYCQDAHSNKPRSLLYRSVGGLGEIIYVHGISKVRVRGPLHHIDKDLALLLQSVLVKLVLEDKAPGNPPYMVR